MEFDSTLQIAGRGAAPSQFHETLRGIAIDRDDRIHAVGDSSVKVFDTSGALLRSWPTSIDGFCVAVDDDGRVWVGQWQQVEIYDADGRLLDTWRDPDHAGLITSIGFASGNVFLADATARCIHRYDSEGVFLHDIGDKHRKGGFHIPNGVVDFSIDGAGILHVANPGMHRVERYTPDGKLLGHFGKFGGTDPVGFQGCCNPTNIAVDPSGRVIVSEKALPRLKIYDPEGGLLTVVAADTFDPSAKNMDIAFDSAGRIYVADTARLEIRVFAPASREVTP